jgi:hypothetical protein
MKMMSLFSMSFLDMGMALIIMLKVFCLFSLSFSISPSSFIYSFLCPATDLLKQEQEFIKYFSDCLNRKLTIVAQNVSATLELSDGEVIRQVADLEPKDVRVGLVRVFFFCLIVLLGG